MKKIFKKKQKIIKSLLKRGGREDVLPTNIGYYSDLKTHIFLFTAHQI
jgi:hypothetical protein